MANTSEDRLRLLQRSLGERDDQLRLALEAAGLGTWHWTPSSGEFACSPRGRVLQGLAADAPLNFESFMASVHAEDRDALIGAMQAALHDGTHFACEYRSIDAGGETRRLHGMGRVIYAGTHGSALRIAGVLQELGAVGEPGDFSGADAATQGAMSGVAKLDRELRFVSANSRFLAALGQDRGGLSGLRLAEVLPGLPAQWREAAASCMDGSVIQSHAESFAPWDRAGERVGGSFYAWYDQRNKPAGVLLVLQAQSVPPLDAPPVAAAALARRPPWSMSALRSAADAAPLAIVAIDASGLVRYSNPAWQSLTGLSPERALHSDWLDTVHEADRQQAAASLRADGSAPADVLTFRLARTAGDACWIDCHVLAQRDDFGRLNGWLLLASDVSDRMAELGSAAQRQNQLRLFARHLERRRELERLELAATLQQDFQDALAHINASLEDLSASPGLAETMRLSLRDLTHQAHQLRDHLREIVFDLAPPGIDELGFAGALRRFASEQQVRSGLQFSLHLPESLEQVAKRTQAVLYSVAREAIGNAVEHAQARRIEVSVELRADHLRLRISDDGVGLNDRERYKPGRFGLFAAAEKLAQVDGVLRVFGVPGSGTVVEAAVTLDTRARPGPPGDRQR